MIYALLTMPLAMPLEKMAEGSVAIPEQITDDRRIGSDAQCADEPMSEYLLDSGCIFGGLEYQNGQNTKYSGSTLSDLNAAAINDYAPAHSGVSLNNMFMTLTQEVYDETFSDMTAETTFKYPYVRTYAGPSTEGELPWDKPAKMEYDQYSAPGAEIHCKVISCPVKIAPVDLSVHGDPMFQHDGKGQHFWLKEGVFSPLLEWKSDDGHTMSLQGLVVANAETGHQWFKQVALVRDGKQVLDTKAFFGTKPMLAMSGEGLALPGETNTTALVDMDTKLVGPKPNQKAVTTVKAGGMKFELTAESAHKFADAAQQQKYAHVNVKMPDGLADGATGLFAELAGAQPMSDATKALLRSPK